MFAHWPLIRRPLCSFMHMQCNAMLCSALHRHTGISRQVVVSREWIHRSLRHVCAASKLLPRHIITPNIQPQSKSRKRTFGAVVEALAPAQQYHGGRTSRIRHCEGVVTNESRAVSIQPTPSTKKRCPSTISFSTAHAFPK
jgi:hypothetical protein